MWASKSASVTAAAVERALGVKRHGAVGDGATNDRAAIATADALGPIEFYSGTYLVSSDLTVTNACLFAKGAKLQPASGVTVTFSGLVWAAARAEVFDYSAGGLVVLNKKQEVWPEWFGSASTAVPRAVAAACAGCDITLSGKYSTDPITLDATNKRGTRLRGVGGPGSRATTTEFGAELAAADPDAGDLLTVQGTGSPSTSHRASIKLDNVRLNGNVTKWAASTAYAPGAFVYASVYPGSLIMFECTTAGTSGVSEPAWSTGLGTTTADNTAVWTTRTARHGLVYSNANDLYIGTLVVDRFGGDAVNCAATQVNGLVAESIDVLTCGRDGIGTGSLGDGYIKRFRAGQCQRFGVQEAGGNNQYGEVRVFQCGEDGVVISNEHAQFGLIHSNDNDENGLRISGSAVDNCVGAAYLRGNGVDSGAASSDRANLQLSGTCARNTIAAYNSIGTGDSGATVTYDIVSSTTGAGNAVKNYRSDGTAVTGLVNGTSGLTAGTVIEPVKVQSIAYAASVTPDPFAGTEIYVGTLTGNLTVNNIASRNNLDGTEITFCFTQDATGGRTITFGANYLVAWTPDTAPNAKSNITFKCRGGIWEQVAAAPAWLSGSATFNPASLADGAGTTTTVTVTGAALGDFAEASFSLDLQGITVTAWVSAANTVSVRFQNETGGTLDLASGTLRARVRKA